MDTTKPLADLRKACADAGLPTYGNKEQLLERLNAAASAELTDNAAPEDVAATETMQASALVAEVGNHGTEPASVPASQQHASPTTSPVVADTRLTIPLEQQIASIGFTGSHNKGQTVTIEHARRVLEEIRNRYPQLNVQLDVDNEVYVFQGGIQGKVTTTIHQPLAAILHHVSGVAPTYVREHREGLATRGALGDLGAKHMVYQ